MTRTPSRSRRRPSSRPAPRPVGHRRARLVGTALAGLAVSSAALAVLPAGETALASHTSPVPVEAQSIARPSAVPLAPVPLATRPATRASRGGGRTALAPVHRVTREVAVGDTFSGRASWYGGSFQGRRTANGERFDTNDLTAASKTLPFGTRLKVCRHARCVVVRINDRGPYVSGRVLDLSRAAVDALGYDGVAVVTATPVERKTVVVRPPVPTVVAQAVKPAVVLAPPAKPVVTPLKPALAADSTAGIAQDRAPADLPGAVLAAALLTLGVGGAHRSRRVRS